MAPSDCTVTIIEDGLAVRRRQTVASETPSMEQPCQLSNVDIEKRRSWRSTLECRSLISSTSGTNVGFDVVDLGSAVPTTIPLHATVRASKGPSASNCGHRSEATAGFSSTTGVNLDGSSPDAR